MVPDTELAHFREPAPLLQYLASRSPPHPLLLLPPHNTTTGAGMHDLCAMTDLLNERSCTLARAILHKYSFANS